MNKMKGEKMKVVIDDYRLEKMDVYTDPLNDKIKRQAAQITRLLADNAELKKGREAIRDNAFEAGLIRGQEEAWKLANKIISADGYSISELKEIFGNKGISWCISSNTYTEAAAKVAEWERKKKEIYVGDIVEFTNGTKAVVIKVYEDGEVALLFSDGGYGTYRPHKKWHKTDRHIDVDAWLAQIGGGSDE